MAQRKSLAEWMRRQDLTVERLAQATNLDEKVVEAIVFGRYTTSPKQRSRIAGVLGADESEIQWGQALEVDHMYGHGPQFGRSP